MSQFNVQQDEDLTLSTSTLLALSEFALEQGLLGNRIEDTDSDDEEAVNTNSDKSMKNKHGDIRKLIELEMNKGHDDLVTYEYNFEPSKVTWERVDSEESEGMSLPFLACFSPLNQYSSAFYAEEASNLAVDTEAVHLPDTVNITLQCIGKEYGQTLNSTGMTIWRASEELVRFIASFPSLFAHKTILELGSGLSLSALFMSKCKLYDQFFCTDGDGLIMSSLVDNMQENLSDALETQEIVLASHSLIETTSLRGGDDVGDMCTSVQKATLREGYDLLQAQRLARYEHNEAMKDHSTTTTGEHRELIESSAKSKGLWIEKLLWGESYLPPFLSSSNTNHIDSNTCIQYQPYIVDILIAADVLYEEESIDPLLETASLLLQASATHQTVSKDRSTQPSAPPFFLLSFARRNVPVEKLLEKAENEYNLHWWKVRDLLDAYQPFVSPVVAETEKEKEGHSFSFEVSHEHEQLFLLSPINLMPSHMTA